MNEQNAQKTVSFWYQIYQKIGPVFIYRACAINIIVFGYTAIFSVLEPNIGEAFAYNLTLTTGLLNLGFAVLIALCGIVVAVFFSTLILGWAYKHLKKEIGRTNSGSTYALPDGLGGDILYIEDLDSANDVNAARIQHYRKVLRDGCYLALLSFRNPFIAFEEGGTGKSWATDRAEFDEQKDVDYSQETTSDFDTFAQGFRRAFSVYCAQRKIQNGANVMDTVSGSMFGNRVSTACFALAFSLLTTSTAFAQNNTQRIVQALGASAQYVPKQGVKVNYTFSGGKSASRTADGTTTIADLYAKGRAGAEGAVNGDVIGVDIDGLAVAVTAVNKRTEKDQPQKEAAKPLFKTALVAANEAAPDSTTFKESLSAYERMTRAKGAEFWSAFSDFMVSDMFNWTINATLVLFLLFRFWANSAVSEARISAYGNTVYGGWALKASNFLKSLAFFLMVVTSALPLSLFAWYMLELRILDAIHVFVNAKMIVFAILCVIFTFFEKIADRLLKNPETIQHERGNGNGNRGQYPANFKG